ncbi:E4 protein [Papillomaviridae sp. Seabass_c17043]|nr:E4 protein [Papillomaviridae sp. Seabass_c17043]
MDSISNSMVRRCIIIDIMIQIQKMRLLKYLLQNHQENTSQKRSTPRSPNQSIGPNQVLYLEAPSTYWGVRDMAYHAFLQKLKIRQCLSFEVQLMF